MQSTTTPQVEEQEYNVHLYLSVRILRKGVKASSMEQAADIAVDDAMQNDSLRQACEDLARRCDFGVDSDFAEEIPTVLVDVVGDDQYEKTRELVWKDGAWVHTRNAVG